jgi:hypothetical protein
MNEIEYYVNKAKEAPNLSWEPYSPFKITFYLGSPVCLTTPWIMFDSLLGHLILLDTMQEDFFVLPRKRNISDFLPENGRSMPLKKTGEIYHASAAIFTPNNGLRVEQMYKRFETVFSDKLNLKKVRIGSGYYRSYALKEPYIPAKTATFFVNGRKNVILELIDKYLVALGNDIRVGWGTIRKFDVEDTDQDYSLVADGIAMRPIPVSLCKWYEDAAVLAYKSPYWDPRNTALCVIPGSRCELNDS